MSLSETAKQMGASKAILMVLEPEDQVALMVNLIRDVASNIKQGVDEGSFTEEQKRKYGSLADKGLEIVDKVYVTYQEDSELQQVVAKQLGKLEMTLYVDSRGRMTGAMVEQFSELKTQDSTVLGINTQTLIDIKNFGKAKAPFAPKADQIIDGNAILSRFLEERKAKKALESEARLDPSEALPSLEGAAAQADLGAAIGSAATEQAALEGGAAGEADADQLSLWMETNQILVESDPESKAEFCEVYAQFDAQSADQKAAALQIFSKNTLSSDAAGAAAAGSVFFRYLAKSYSDQDLDCSTAP